MNFLLILSFLTSILCGVSATAKDASNSREDETFISADLLLPQSVASFISIRDIHVLDNGWDKTALGKMMAREDMEDFAKLFRKQFAEIFSTLESQLGVTTEEIIQMTDSEVAVSSQKVKENDYGTILVINVGDKIFETKKVLSKIAERVLQKGGNYQKQEAINTEIHILTMKDKETGKLSKAYYVLWGEILFSSNQQLIVKDMLGRIAKLQKNPDAYVGALGEKEEYIEILNQTVGTNEKLPDIIWYVDPFQAAEVQRMLAIKRDPSVADKRNSTLVFKNAGFDGIKAIGGVFTCKNQGYDITQRMFTYIPEAPEKSLKMLSFDKTADKEIPDWITEDFGCVHVVNLDILNAFDNVGPLVDGMFGEDRESVWEDVLDGLKKDTKGPMIDLREDITAFLENKVIFTVANVDPKVIDGERYLILIPSKNDAKLRENLGRFFSGEQNYKVVSSGEDIRWVQVENQERENEFAEQKSSAKRFRQPTITIWNGYLLVASQPDYIDVVKSGLKNGKKPMAQNPDYKRIQFEAAQNAKGLNPCSFHFSNNAVERQHAYEMAKAGKWTKSSAMYSSTLDRYFRENQNVESHLNKFDNSNLPDFEMVKKYFLPSGGYMYEVKNGILYQGFLMSEEKMGISLK